MAERLFDHDAAPELMLPVLVLALIGKLRFAKSVYHGAKESVGDGEVENDVALRAMGFLCRVQRIPNILVQLGLGKISGHV